MVVITSLLLYFNIQHLYISTNTVFNFNQLLGTEESGLLRFDWKYRTQTLWPSVMFVCLPCLSLCAHVFKYSFFLSMKNNSIATINFHCKFAILFSHVPCFVIKKKLCQRDVNIILSQNTAPGLPLFLDPFKKKFILCEVSQELSISIIYLHPKYFLNFRPPDISRVLGNWSSCCSYPSC